MPPTNLAAAMPRLASPATITVPVLSPPEPPSGLPTSPGVGGPGVGGPGVPDTDPGFSTDGPGSLMTAPLPPGGSQHAPRRRLSAHPDEVDDEDERRARLDDAAGAAV